MLTKLDKIKLKNMMVQFLCAGRDKFLQTILKHRSIAPIGRIQVIEDSLVEGEALINRIQHMDTDCSDEEFCRYVQEYEDFILSQRKKYGSKEE